MYSPQKSGGVGGIRISVRTSPGSMIVLPGPIKNSSSKTIFSPSHRDIFTLALTTSRAGATSAEGVAFAIFPPIVARFRICIDPTSAALCAKNEYFLRITDAVSISRIVVRAPIVSDPSEASRIPVSEGIFLRSTTYRGTRPFSLIAMTRSVPPARKYPPGPFFLKSSRASGIEAG